MPAEKDECAGNVQEASITHTFELIRLAIVSINKSSDYCTKNLMILKIIIYYSQRLYVQFDWN